MLTWEEHKNGDFYADTDLGQYHVFMRVGVWYWCFAESPSQMCVIFENAIIAAEKHWKSHV